MKRKVIKSSLCRKAWASMEIKKERSGMAGGRVLQCETHKPQSSTLPRHPWLCSSPAAGLPGGCHRLLLPKFGPGSLLSLPCESSPVTCKQNRFNVRITKQFLTQFDTQQFGCWVSTEISYRHYTSNSPQNCSPKPTCEAQHGPVVFFTTYIF